MQSAKKKKKKTLLVWIPLSQIQLDRWHRKRGILAFQSMSREMKVLKWNVLHTSSIYFITESFQPELSWLGQRLKKDRIGAELPRNIELVTFWHFLQYMLQFISEFPDRIAIRKGHVKCQGTYHGNAYRIGTCLTHPWSDNGSFLEIFAWEAKSIRDHHIIWFSVAFVLTPLMV